MLFRSVVCVWCVSVVCGVCLLCVCCVSGVCGVCQFISNRGGLCFGLDWFVCVCFFLFFLLQSYRVDFYVISSNVQGACG